MTEISEIKVRSKKKKGTRRTDVTDQGLLLKSSEDGLVTQWDSSSIVSHLVEKLGMSDEDAQKVAKKVEKQVLDLNMSVIDSELIRELVNSNLVNMGYHGKLKDLSVYPISREFIENLMYDKSNENSNIVNNNPEAINLAIAELALKQWALDAVFSDEVKNAHDTGMVHLHDLGYPHRVYCSSHSIEYLKKYGLKGLTNLNTTSAPANSASVLTGHLNTFLASMQANYAGALGIAYINIFYAPYLIGMSDKQMFQIAQELIFNGSQNAFSRGGQTLFLDFNIHTGVPSYLKKVPAIGKGGKYYFLKNGDSIEDTDKWIPLNESTSFSGDWILSLPSEDERDEKTVLREHEGKQEFLPNEEGRILTYGDFEEQARKFTIQLLNVWEKGDAEGRVFEFPKCDFHVSAETFEDPKQYEVYMKACELASVNGSTYFIFDRDEVTLSACCRLRTTINDNRMLIHPETMRFCGFQNVTINIPQCAYRAKRKGTDDVWKEFYNEIDRTMDIAVKAHLQKKAAIAKLMQNSHGPLWQIGKIANDGVPYVDLEKCTYIIGLIGVNDAVKFLYGKEFHQDEHAIDLGLEIVSHMYLRAKHYTEEYGLKFTLEESPAESAARKLAKNDLVYFRDEAKDIVKGDDEDYAYYTNSVHISADAPVSLVERIEKQAMFHSVIESGAITHAFVGEERPAKETIAELMKQVFYRTQSAQVTISPEFTYCNDCGHKENGLVTKCPQCGSENVVGETRVVGYFSKVQNWNKSKRYGELVARQRGRYSVMNASDEVASC